MNQKPSDDRRRSTAAAIAGRAVDLARMKLHLSAAISNLEIYERIAGKQITARGPTHRPRKTPSPAGRISATSEPIDAPCAA